MAKDDVKMRSSARRKPLRDLSNGGIRISLSRSAKSNKKKEKVKEEDETKMPQQLQTLNQTLTVVDNPIDCLLLSHSHLSSLLRQIDELVAQAVNVKENDNKKNDEIRSFANVLTQFYSSLKPSVIRLEKALASCHIVEPEIQQDESPARVPTVVKESDKHVDDTPEPTKQDSLVSPSPLVSWRATDCLIERGKQLFLLTPLPRPKTTVSKAPASSRLTTIEGITLSNPFQIASLCAQPSESKYDKAEPVTKIVENTSGFGSDTLLNIPVANRSSVLATPCLKIPPRSCALLETNRVEKSDKPLLSTPYLAGNKKLCEFTDSENSSGEAKLGLKYPELIGIRQSFMMGNATKAVEASPAWIMSPPKCCTLLEPIDEKPARDGKAIPCDLNQQVCPVSPTKSSIQTTDQDQGKKNLFGQDNLVRSLAMVESTPLWKGCESTILKSKRAGENTLKRELWTKFEAASMDEFHLNFCVLKDTSEKGFLDRLDEASCDHVTPHSDPLR